MALVPCVLVLVQGQPILTRVSSVKSEGPVATQSAAQTKLKVEDALSYLDQVKLQFAKLPQVYNDFLDIMKEFKSANIDTPGVIQRVSELFEGHTDLIVGFNTFLPPGYKIEIESPQNGQPGQILVTIDDTITEQGRDGRGGGGRQQLYARTGQPMVPQGQFPPGALHPPGGPAGAQYRQTVAAQMSEHDARSMPIQNQAPPSARGPQQRAPQQPVQQGQPQEGGTGQGKARLEFDHAIRYVNKIKTTFSEDPKIYKLFLEILHNYQNEKKSIQQVYQEVEHLFHNQPELLEEFAQFLPEAGAEHLAAQAKHAQNNAARAAAEQANYNNQNWNQKGRGRDNKRKGKGKDSSQVNTEIADLKELAFFDKVKKNFKSKQVFDNFLRCLNLYSHEIINAQELVELVSGFLGRFDDLMAWFKKFVGYRERSGMDDKSKLHDQPELDLRTCKQLDKSYRALPHLHQERPCSGRAVLKDEIAKTLNNKWVSFPTWSEDSASFLTTKKNSHEEAIFRCEDERFELDIVLEANIRTIAVLDSVVKNLEHMTPDQRASYKFDKRTLGGDSRIIHYKAVQRIYGDRVDEVLAGLERDPLANIPLVLKRLKQKNQEWRATQRQWNTVWKEINEKHYLRSLDYKAPNFKKSDGMNLKAKALKEKLIDQRDDYRKWKKQRLAAGESVDGGDGPPRPVYQFKYEDAEVLDDINRLIMRQAKKLNVAADTKHMAAVLTSFIPELLFLKTDDKTPVDFLESPDKPAATTTSAAESQAQDTEDDKDDVRSSSRASQDPPAKPAETADAAAAAAEDAPAAKEAEMDTSTAQADADAAPQKVDTEEGGEPNSADADADTDADSDAVKAIMTKVNREAPTEPTNPVEASGTFSLVLLLSF